MSFKSVLRKWFWPGMAALFGGLYCISPKEPPRLRDFPIPPEVTRWYRQCAGSRTDYSPPTTLEGLVRVDAGIESSPDGRVAVDTTGGSVRILKGGLEGLTVQGGFCGWAEDGGFYVFSSKGLDGSLKARDVFKCDGYRFVRVSGHADALRSGVLRHLLASGSLLMPVGVMAYAALVASRLRRRRQLVLEDDSALSHKHCWPIRHPWLGGMAAGVFVGIGPQIVYGMGFDWLDSFWNRLALQAGVSLSRAFCVGLASYLVFDFLSYVRPPLCSLFSRPFRDPAKLPELWMYDSFSRHICSAADRLMKDDVPGMLDEVQKYLTAARVDPDRERLHLYSFPERAAMLLSAWAMRHDWKYADNLVSALIECDWDRAVDALTSRASGSVDPLGHLALRALVGDIAGNDSHEDWARVVVAADGLPVRRVPGSCAEFRTIDVSGVLGRMIGLKFSADVGAQRRQFGEYRYLNGIAPRSVPVPHAIVDVKSGVVQVLQLLSGVFPLKSDYGLVRDAYLDSFARADVSRVAPLDYDAVLAKSAARFLGLPGLSPACEELSAVNSFLSQSLSSSPRAYCLGNMHRSNVLCDGRGVMFIDPEPVAAYGLDLGMLASSLRAPVEGDLAPRLLASEILLGRAAHYGEGSLAERIDDFAECVTVLGERLPAARSLGGRLRDWRALPG